MRQLLFELPLSPWAAIVKTFAYIRSDHNEGLLVTIHYLSGRRLDRWLEVLVLQLDRLWPRRRRRRWLIGLLLLLRRGRQPPHERLCFLDGHAAHRLGRRLASAHYDGPGLVALAERGGRRLGGEHRRGLGPEGRWGSAEWGAGRRGAGRTCG